MKQLDGFALIKLGANDEIDRDRPNHVHQRVNNFVRNRAMDADHRSVEEVTVDGNQYNVGQFVELSDHLGEHMVSEAKNIRSTALGDEKQTANLDKQIEFVEIKSIYIHNETGESVVRGLPYARTRNLHGCLPQKQNEVCLILEVDANDERADEEQALIEIWPEEILKQRVLTTTNKSYPLCRFDPVAYVTAEQKESQAPLACRWKMRAEYKDESQRRAGRMQGQIFEHLSERDGQKIKRRNLGIDKQRSQEWRGETIAGGSELGALELIKDENQGNIPAPDQKYSFAEVSGGSGGASRGAEMAGFKPVLAAESCQHACNSYRSNFPNTELLEMQTTEFATSGGQRIVDVLHISSSALSTTDDDESTKEKCTNLINKFRSRVIMMEQPSCITSEQKISHLNTIIQSFTNAGYSIQWKIVHMVDYGLPQTRKRLIMIAAGPGEALAQWPTATHSLNPAEDQQPFKTEEEAISGLCPELHPLHNPEDVRELNRPARDADMPIGAPINASGSTYSHPDGDREFTLRELACLQGFPTYHEFEDSYIKKQIGNAFPPSVAMAFYQSLRQHMEKVDGIHSRLLQAIQPPQPARSPNASLPEVNNGSGMRISQPREAGDGTPDAAMPDAPQHVRRIAQPVRPSTGHRTRAFVPPVSPRLTMSPEAESNAGGRSSTPDTPSPPRQLPTPSTGSSSLMGPREAVIRTKRQRAMLEESESDGDDDRGHPAPHTPCKRQRVYVSRL